MRPDPPTAAESKIIRWFFGVLFGAAILFIAWGWHGRTQACIASCRAQGFESGCLELTGETRLSLASECACKN
jgi:hypothetical protein